MACAACHGETFSLSGRSKTRTPHTPPGNTVCAFWRALRERTVRQYPLWWREEAPLPGDIAWVFKERGMGWPVVEGSVAILLFINTSLWRKESFLVEERNLPLHMHALHGVWREEVMVIHLTETTQFVFLLQAFALPCLPVACREKKNTCPPVLEPYSHWHWHALSSTTKLPLISLFGSWENSLRRKEEDTGKGGGRTGWGKGSRLSSRHFLEKTLLPLKTGMAISNRETSPACTHLLS